MGTWEAAKEVDSFTFFESLIYVLSARRETFFASLFANLQLSKRNEKDLLVLDSEKFLRTLS